MPNKKQPSCMVITPSDQEPILVYKCLSAAMNGYHYCNCPEAPDFIASAVDLNINGSQTSTHQTRRILNLEIIKRLMPICVEIGFKGEIAILEKREKQSRNATISHEDLFLYLIRSIQDANTYCDIHGIDQMKYQVAIANLVSGICEATAQKQFMEEAGRLKREVEVGSLRATSETILKAIQILLSIWDIS